MQARKDELGIKGTCLENYKNIFDLYITDSTTEPSQLSSKTGDDANSEFALGEAAFYQNGTWAWTNLQNAGMTAEQVGMMPIYIGDPDEQDEGLATGSENYWCINSKAYEPTRRPPPSSSSGSSLLTPARRR